MVGANTFRNPALVAKMVTTLDHISGGRAVLGIGAAWFETEHAAFGLRVRHGVPGSGCAGSARRCRSCAACSTASGPRRVDVATGPKRCSTLPAPVQEHLPILVGGTGRKVTLRLVAEYADACNIGGAARTCTEKDAVLVGHCEAVGRDEKSIERTVGMGTPFIRDSREEAFTVMADVFADNGDARTWTNMPIGTVEHVVEHCKPYLDQGYRHLIFGFPAPYDEETLERLAHEVRPRLEAHLSA